MTGIEVARDAATISTNALLAELRRRQDDGERPECGTRESGWYNTAAHVFALFLILTLSTLACGFPLLSRRTSTGRRQKAIIFYCQHAGTGVLIATAFVHLLPTAFESLTDPCLPYFFSEGYTALPGVVAMMSALVVVALESYLTARGAGHSHSHGGFWDEDDANHNAPQGDGQAEHEDIPLDDVADTDGLVAGSSAMGTDRRDKPADGAFNEDDSDLDLDVDELDPAPASSNGGAGRYASVKHKHTHTRSESFSAAAQTPEEHHRQLLQCLLLEAGILFHSIFIGMAISVATGPAFVVFLVAISFHQTFEGLALGSRIAAIQFPRNSLRPWLMVLAYGTTTPLGQAIGLVVHKLYDPHSMGGLLVVGFMNAISSGLLLYAGLVQLLAEDFLSEKSFKVLQGRKRLHAFLAVVAGAILMAVVGAFA